MLITVIIPTYNRNESLSICLGRLHPGIQGASVAYEVIVSDDSENEVAYSLIQKMFPWVTWIKGPQKGPAANRNNGAIQAKGDWLVFTDDDCVPDVGWLNAFTESITDDRHIVYEGLTYADRERRRFDEESPINLDGQKLWSCNFAISRTLYFELGGFDENFPYAAMEDVDIQLRIRNVARIEFVSTARVMHPWRMQKQGLEINIKRFKSLIFFLEKWPQERQKYDLGYFLRSAIVFTIDLFKNVFKYRFRGVTSRLSHISLTILFGLIILVKGFKYK